MQDQNGEALPAASIVILPDSIILNSDTQGKFEANLSSGQKNVRISYTGFEVSNLAFKLKRDTFLITVLTQRVDQLKEVTVEGDRYSNGDIVQSTRSGLHRLTQEDLNAIPALMGEADLIKTLQLLP